MTIKSTLTDAIAEDHREMYLYHSEYLKSEGNVDAQTRWANQLMWEVARHATAEELVVYPLLERHLGPHGVKLADHDRAEHQVVKEKLKKLESMKAGTPDFTALLNQVVNNDLRPHNDSEEAEDLPLLEPVLGPESSHSAAADFDRTKLFVPTRPHPSAPNKPPYETLAGFLAMPMDKLKDMFSKFPSREMLQEAKKAGGLAK